MSQVQKITPFLWFDTQAQAAAEFYVSVFPDSRIASSNPMLVTFELNGLNLVALNGGPQFHFTEAISLWVHCTSQAEVDRYWDVLTADGGEASQCGWLKDKYGLSWQIVPAALNHLMSTGTPEQGKRVFDPMMQMQKLIIADLQKAFDGK